MPCNPSRIYAPALSRHKPARRLPVGHALVSCQAAMQPVAHLFHQASSRHLVFCIASFTTQALSCSCHCINSRHQGLDQFMIKLELSPTIQLGVAGSPKGGPGDQRGVNSTYCQAAGPAACSSSALLCGGWQGVPRSGFTFAEPRCTGTASNFQLTVALAHLAPLSVGIACSVTFIPHCRLSPHGVYRRMQQQTYMQSPSK